MWIGGCPCGAIECECKDDPFRLAYAIAVGARNGPAGRTTRWRASQKRRSNSPKPRRKCSPSTVPSRNVDFAEVAAVRSGIDTSLPSTIFDPKQAIRQGGKQS